MEMDVLDFKIGLEGFVIVGVLTPGFSSWERCISIVIASSANLTALALKSQLRGSNEGE